MRNEGQKARRRRSVIGRLVPALLLAVLALAPHRAAAQAIRGEISTSTDNGYARLVFHLSEEVESQVRLSNNIVTISFAKPVDIALDRVSANASGYVSAARRDPDGRAIRLALARKVTMNSMAAGERLFVDLLPDTWTGVPPGLPRDVIDELSRRAREAERRVRQQRTLERQTRMAPIVVKVVSQPTFIRYVFDLPELIGVSADNTRDKLTLTFDAVLRFDLADAKATRPPAIDSIESEADQDSVIVRFNFGSKVDVRTFREDNSYVVDVSEADAKSAQRDGEVRSDELTKLALEVATRNAAGPSGIQPPRTVPARRADAAPPEGPSEQPRAAPGAPAAKAAAQSPPPAAREPVPSPPRQPPQGAQARVEPPPAAPAPAAPPPAAPPQAAPPSPSPAPPPAAAKPLPAAPQAAAPVEPAAEAQPAARLAAEAAMAGGDQSPRETTRDGGSIVRAALKRNGETLTVVFPFEAPTPAAVFRRGDTLWLVFDTDDTVAVGALHGDKAIRAATAARQRSVAVVRLRLDKPQLVSVAADGPGWVVTLGNEVVEPTRPLTMTRNIVGPSRSSMVIPFDDPRRLHRLEDPDAGDVLLVVTAAAPVRGFLRGQDFVELRALASTQGVALQPIADDLSAELAPDKIIIARPSGLTLSPAINTGSRTILHRQVLDAQAWGFDRQANFAERSGQLLTAAADAPESRRLAARADLARFYLARDMYAEAKAVLDVALADNPPTSEDVSAAVLRAIANILLGRAEAGLKDLSLPIVGNLHDAQLWRALANARVGKWTEAREHFRSSEVAMGTLPLELQRVMLKDMIRAFVEVGDITGAARQLNDFELIGIPRELEPAMSVLAGRLAEGLGRIEDALRAYRAATDSWDRPAAAQGRLRETLLQHAQGTVKRAEAINDLETLTTIWRGDETEVEALQLLARLYTEETRFRDAFRVMRTALSAHPNSDMSRRIQEEAVMTFDSLFLAGKGDALPAIDALALFYDFRELTPIGRRGDEMIRRLADRLVSVDLLYQAGELLQHQIDHRLQGAARAQVATRLAVIYLMDRKPDRALGVLRTTRTTGLNNDLRNQRLLLEAKSLSQVGRHDVAVEVIENVPGREAVRLRSDIHWAAKQWRLAAEQLELLLGARWEEFAPLTETERADVMRAAIGYSLGDDTIGLGRFREKYAAKMGEGPERRAFDVVTAPIGMGGTEFRDIARSIAAVDTLEAFLRDLRARYPETGAMPGGGPRPAPPAAQAPRTAPATNGAAAPASNAAG